MILMSRDDIVKRLTDIFLLASNGRAQSIQLNDEARIIEDVGLSSLDFLDLRQQIESLWHLRIRDHELGQLRTIGDLVRIIQERAESASK